MSNDAGHLLRTCLDSSLVGRILCLDYGERRTGLALSDETQTIASALGTVEHQNVNELIRALRPLTKEHEVSELLLGLPLGRTGRPSARSEQIRQVGQLLATELNLPVYYHSERCSTVRAAAALSESKNRPRRRKVTGGFQLRHPALDRIAATIILEDYLESRR